MYDVYVCFSVCVYTCVRVVCLCLCTYIRIMYVRMSTRFLCVHVMCLCICIYVRMCIRLLCIYVQCVCITIYRYICIRFCMCIYVFVCVEIHVWVFVCGVYGCACMTYTIGRMFYWRSLGMENLKYGNTSGRVSHSPNQRHRSYYTVFTTVP